ncbi:hypothetical protein Dimus_037355 [Dionaea muscipula]
MNMAEPSSFSLNNIIFVLLFFMVFEISRSQMVPAMFVFGDSLVDVGNNDYLELSILKANFPFNGIDFPSHKPTGRFSNGKNAADFLAERLGLPSPPPYLSLVHNHNNNTNFLTGVSFASGGAGILDATSMIFQQLLSMNEQIECFTKVQGQMANQIGESAAQNIVSKSLFVMVIGNNDLLGYFKSNSNSTTKAAMDPKQLVDSMIGNLTGQIQRMYDLGARRFAVIGVAPVGCCPSRRRDRAPWECNEEANDCANEFNGRLRSLLEGQFKSKLNGFQYSFLDLYNLILDYIQNPTLYGFKEVKAACCGLGPLNSKIPCLPISSCCENRSDHLFWDLFHPTEKTARMVIQTAFDGLTPNSYSFPVTLSQLLATT